MRRLLLAAVICGAAQGAYAADMPDLPVLRGSLPEGLSTVRTVWQGYYIGGQASYGSVTSKPSPTLNSDLQNTLVPPAGSPSSSYPRPLLDSASERGAGWGAFFGYNSQWDDVVIGVEGNYIHSGLNAFTSKTGYFPSRALPTTMTATSSATIRSTDFGSARLRAGYIIDCFLPYAFIGGGMGSQTVDRNVSADPAPMPLPTLQTRATKTSLVYGYSAGVGVDVMLMAGLFLRAEYEYQRVTSTIESNINSARVGIGYKF
jgi:opacity protein-like surface antigen